MRQLKLNRFKFRILVLLFLLILSPSCIERDYYSDVEIHITFNDDESGEVYIYLNLVNETPSSANIDKLEKELRKTKFESIQMTSEGYEIKYKFNNIDEFQSKINDFLQSRELDEFIKIDVQKQSRLFGTYNSYHFKVNISNKIFGYISDVSIQITPPGKITYYSSGYEKFGRVTWKIKKSDKKYHILEMESNKRDIPNYILYILTGLIGAIVTIAGHFTLSYFDTFRKKRTIKRALKIEILNNLELLKKNNKTIKKMKNNPIEIFIDLIYAPSTADLFTNFQTIFFKSNLNELGNFDHGLMQKISNLYHNYYLIEIMKNDIKKIINDIKIGKIKNLGDIKTVSKIDLNELLGDYSRLIDESIQISKEILKDL